MGLKLDRNTYPDGKSSKDFKCYGPVAEKDTEFVGFKMADMGCFQQDDVDSNKYYHVSMCTDDQGKWYVYVEYGRVGAAKPSFQFTSCSSEADAQSHFVKQCEEKNTKRGQWEDRGLGKRFYPKPKKDMYRVQKLAKRSFGLPDAQNIAVESAAKQPTKKLRDKKSYRCDQPTTKLMSDLLGGAVSFTRTSIEGGTIPTVSAIKDGRDLIQDALKRIKAVGDDVKDQVNDKLLRDITYELYSRIPKKKALHVADEEWILSKQNTVMWSNDLDAFETAALSGDFEVESNDDPMADMPHVHMEWIDPKSDLGKHLYQWWPNATNNRHSHVGRMTIKNMWKVERKGDLEELAANQQAIANDISSKKWNQERPLFQERNRFDLDEEKQKLYWQTNTGLLFHGTRTVNVPGIVRSNLRLPNTLVGVVITGAMFGPGLYWADDWKKSDGYTSNRHSYYSHGSGGVNGRHAFMFAADVTLGIPHVANGPSGYTSPPGGSHCVFGKAGFSKVANNEWIVYSRGRNVLRYLIEYTTG